MFQRLLFAVVAIVALMGVAVAPAAADHGLGHNGETMELSAHEGLADGDVVTVNLSSFLPGAMVTVVTCFAYPAVGPTDCELSNYGMHTADIHDDGTATMEYPVAWVDGRCDPDNPCFIVAGDGIGPEANYAGVEVTFGDGAAMTEAADEPAAEAPAAETTAAETPAADAALAETGAASDLLAVLALTLVGGGFLFLQASGRIRRL